MIVEDSRKKSEVAPAQPAVTVTAGPDLNNLSPDDLKALITLLVRREARAATKEEAEFEKQETRRRQYAKNSEANESTMLKVQAKCKHLKGGKHRRATQAEDPNVSLHIFITGEAYIKCHNCNMKWRPQDTKEVRVANGKKYQNHTKIGWEEAKALFEKSSNTKTSSEIPPQMWANVTKEFAPRTMEDEIGVSTDPIGDAEVTGISTI